MDQENTAVQEWHRKQAIQCFNETWNLIDKGARSRAEELQMIHMAHASRFHWAEVGTPVHWLRGEWQISRVYALLGLGESALLHAQYCLDLCVANGTGGFDLAFAYEALARAYCVRGQEIEKTQSLTLAKTVAEQVERAEDRDYLLSELQTIK